jgi:EAL domain-containing protein (putative c-di-GMP-specific phosphodiesterase class I)
MSCNDAATPGASYLERFFDGTEAAGCLRCRDDNPFLTPVRMAFQPIIDIRSREVFAYEALVRGDNGEGAGSVIAGVTPEQLYAFDQTCRVLAIETAQRIGMQTRLSINFMPNAVYQPSTCIQLTLAAAAKVGFATDRLIFELTESEQIRQPEHVLAIVRDYQKRGFMTAIDDFGAGFAGLNLLAQFQPHLVKLDMALTRDIDTDRVRLAIVTGVLHSCRALGCEVVAEGIETRNELRCLRDLGVHLIQGYLLARPALEALPPVDWAVLDG